MILRYGLLGTGYWAAQTQAAALSGHPDARFVGVWGRDHDKARALAERYSVTAFADVDELIDSVDAVAVALPPDVQADLAERAAHAGRHLLLDKPLALSVEGARRVVEAVERYRLASLVFTTNRYQPAVVEFLERLAESGGWRGARVSMCTTIYTPGNPYAGSAWRRDKGGLWDLGPHALSLILPVLGPVAEVTAVAAARNTHHLILRHRHGAVSTLALTLDAPPAATLGEVLFHGESGLATAPEWDLTAVDAFRIAIARLSRNVAAGTPRDPLDVRAGLDAVVILAAAEDSARHGVTVRL